MRSRDIRTTSNARVFRFLPAWRDQLGGLGAALSFAPVKCTFTLSGRDEPIDALRKVAPQSFLHPCAAMVRIEIKEPPGPFWLPFRR